MLKIYCKKSTCYSECLTKPTAFISLKDQKDNFQSSFLCPLLSTFKGEFGTIKQFDLAKHKPTSNYPNPH